MRDFLIGMGIGFVVGAVLAKTNKDVSSAVNKGKKMVEEKVEEGKQFVEEKIIKPKNIKNKAKITKK